MKDKLSEFQALLDARSLVAGAITEAAYQPVPGRAAERALRLARIYAYLDRQVFYAYRDDPQLLKG